VIPLGATILWVAAVRRIVEEREAAGPYRTVGDLVRVAGFGSSRVRGLTPRVKV
jgi:DNA uptake protein ComE-like DNA-binding protein